MNEVFQPFIEDPSVEGNKPTVFPAANSTSAFQISAGYMHVIVAIYAIVVVLVIFIVIMIIVQSIRRSWTKKDKTRYGAIPRHDRQTSIPQRVDDLDPDVEILDGNTRIYGPPQDNDSEYDNISLNLGSEDHGNNKEDSPPIYENPPPYLSINR
ncbi:unnamed protein product [Larinioides sclopetarius]|uniref:Uncharacterized protein n=1 Tax=Larinioides sclopetarius TaxID=280406 RepID=A0AAV2A2L0_9ARAC